MIKVMIKRKQTCRMLQIRTLQSQEVLVKNVPSEEVQKEVTRSVCP